MTTTEFIRVPPVSAGEKLLQRAQETVARLASMWRAARNRRSVGKLL